jgi:hypothetical protein
MLCSEAASLLVGLYGFTWPKHASHCVPVKLSNIAVALCAAVTDLIRMKSYAKLSSLSLSFKSISLNPVHSIPNPA